MNNSDGWDIKPIGWENITKINHISGTNTHETNNKYKNIKLDAIFVLAGGLDHKGQVHEFVKERLDLAISIYCTLNKNIKIICLGGGTYHKPPFLNKSSYVIHESSSCSEYLITKGVDPHNIYKEYSSYDTVANGFYAYLNFILPMGLQNILIITSEFHIQRSRTIFDWILGFDANKYNIIYEETDNIGMDPCILESRRTRESESNRNLKNNLIPRIGSFAEFHKWFYEEHKAYCSNSQLIKNDTIDENIKKTY
jgi:vancomycin permeability regulator SanA